MEKSSNSFKNIVIRTVASILLILFSMVNAIPAADLENRNDLVFNSSIKASSRDIQGQDKFGISEFIHEIYKLLGGNLSAVGFAAGLPIAVGTAIFWGIVFLIIYHVFFSSSKGFFDYFKNEDDNNGGGSGYPYKRKSDYFPISPTQNNLNQLSQIVYKAIDLFKG